MEKYTNFKQRSNLNNKGIIKTCFNILEEKVRKYNFYYCVTFGIFYSKIPILDQIIIPAGIKKVLAGIMKLVLVLAAWPALSGQN